MKTSVTLAIVEVMPEHLRASHRAAGNWGRYPHNGAEHRAMSAEEAEYCEGDEYDHVVGEVTATIDEDGVSIYDAESHLLCCWTFYTNAEVPSSKPGKWDGSIQDCPVDLGDGVYEALEAALIEAGAPAPIDIDVQHVDGDGIALYCKYPGQGGPQDCFVELDCEKRTLSAEYNPEIGNAIPFRVYHGRTIRWTIPCLTDDAVNDLLDELAEDAAAVCDGYTCEWDGNNHVGNLDDEAKAASERIHAATGRDWSERDTVNVWDASDWYEPVYRVTEELGITAETTDERIREIAEEEEEKASADGHTVEGIEQHLLGLRNELRDEAEE